VGLQPDDRLPLDAYYAYLAFKNGVPVSYGAGWGCLGTLEFALNIFESFRQGESALVIGQILRVYYQLFRMRTVVVDRSQIDDSNPEGLRTGAFYFYAKLGFRRSTRRSAGSPTPSGPGSRATRTIARRCPCSGAWGARTSP